MVKRVERDENKVEKHEKLMKHRQGDSPVRNVLK